MKPYKWVARFYDQIHGGQAPRMNRHARRKVLGRILRRARAVCDLGCGTGSTAIELARDGRVVFAVDNSPEMCRRARAKARRAGVPVRVICGDMRRLRLPQPVDLVLSEFNPLNHLPRKSDLERVARRVARALRPGGYFYFDLNTPRTQQEVYPGTHWMEGRGFMLVMRGGYDRRRRKGWLRLDWFLRSGKLWRHARERLEDVAWTHAEVKRALSRAGFVRIRSWDGVDVRPRFPGQRRGFDVYLLAQKPARAPARRARRS
jgi:SAM-dependent methyltransferase